MKRLIIICEGQTEQAFIKSLISPYFSKKEILIQTPLFKKSGDGIVPWKNIKSQIIKHLLQEKDAFVTTFFDFYGIYAKHQFPKWEDAQKISDKNQKIKFLEENMKTSIGNQLSNRFIPYIQLHEFEGLLFNNIKYFDDNFDSYEFQRENIAKIISQFPNPEMINDSPNTAPSKRLEQNIEGYNKVVFGCILAESIGLTNIRGKSPRFNQWISTLENL